MHLLVEIMCDLAAAINPHSQGLAGWDCSGSTPSPSVLCVWGGVICNGDSSVINIDLHNRGLDGTLPASIGGLSSLIYLSLSYNLLTGVIPTSTVGCYLWLILMSAITTYRARSHL